MTTDFTGSFFPNPLKLFDKDNDGSSLHQLNIFGSDPFDSYDTPDVITDASSEKNQPVDNHDQPENQEPDDIWSLDQLNQTPSHKPPTRSWETYQDPSFREPPSAYLSETGAKGFDAILAQQERVSGIGSSGRIVRNDVFFRSLFLLGLGWNSMFFRYNHEKGKFEKYPADIRISGISLYALDNVVHGIQKCGTDMMRVRAFVRSIAAKSIESSALSTLASAAAIIVYTLEDLLSKHFADFEHRVSLLQVKVLFQRCGELVGVLANLLEAAESAESDSQAISVTLERVAYFSQQYTWLERILNELVVRVTQPWRDFVEAWIGLRSEEATFTGLLKNNDSFVKLDHVEEPWKLGSKPVRAEYRYQPDRIPLFIPAEQAALIFESGRSLRLLKRSHPQHPIANEDMLRGTAPPKLQCAITWSDIERIQNNAHQYEAKLRAEILRYNRGETATKQMTDNQTSSANNAPEADDALAGTFQMLDFDNEQQTTALPTNRSSEEDDRLCRLLNDSSEQEANHEDIFGPELPYAFYLSLAPVITSQALLIDFSCLHLLFKEHGVRHHLTAQWRFQLLGDGFFTCRLSNALFAPDMGSAERKSGVARGDVHTGLRLGNRDTWPPASSELRLVLTNLLDECNNSSPEGDVHKAKTGEDLDDDKELPGGLSFAIRNLSDEELVKCKDPNAIEALDFLRLQYKPSVVLETIFTSRSLDQYDILFKHLLRLIRMITVVHGLVRDSTARTSQTGDSRNPYQRFRIEAQHFILTLSEYCFTVGIGSTWNRFQHTLSKIEHSLDRGDIDATIEAAQSVPHFRQLHEDILDQILFALFLSKRHVQVAKLLESIFAIILAFAPFSKLDGTNGVRNGRHEEAVLKLYASFRKRVVGFVRYLRQLDGGRTAVSSSKKSTGRSAGPAAGAALTSNTSRADPTTVFEYLLVRFDMKQYY